MLLLLFWMITYSFEITTAAQELVKKEPSPTEWNGYSWTYHVFLPMTGLAVLWGNRGIFSRLFLHIDRSCVSVYCPSLSKRDKLLRWASTRLPLTWSSPARTLSSGIPELWRDGSLLCTLINSVVPGACPNPHRHWRKAPTHAQALAFKYLGLVPQFSDAELCAEFTLNQELKFIHYLNELQQAINKWPTTSETNRKFSSQYVARGMGLYTGEQYRKTIFYIYSDLTAKNRNNVFMYIRGPYGSQGKATIPPFLKNIPTLHIDATEILPFKSNEHKSFLKTISLDFTSLLHADSSNHPADEISIQIDMEIDRARVTYIPNSTGMYEISLISNGELLRGSPYSVRVTANFTNERDSFEHAQVVVPHQHKATYTKRKVLSKVIDCIDEQISVDDTEQAYDSLDACIWEESAQNAALDDIAEESSAILNEAEVDLIPASNEMAPLERIARRIHVEASGDRPPSPVCPDHIAEKEGRTLAEKRRVFAGRQQSAASGAPEAWQELSVLHYLDAIKLATSTTSLPDMCALEERRSVRARRQLWEERMAARSSSSLHSDCAHRSRSALDKNLFDRFNDEKSSSEKELKYAKKMVDRNERMLLKSVIPYEATPGSYIKYKSLDDSLENCSTMTIEERKKVLLKELYEAEKDVRVKATFKNNFNEVKRSNKLQFFQSLQNEKSQDNKAANNVKVSNLSQNALETAELKPKSENIIKTQFKRAFKIFKNLENDSKIRNVSEKDRCKRKVFKKRRVSLDLFKQKSNNNTKPGGSLNLPNISERFSINNIYKDVFGNKKGSFKGAPNKIALNKTLASMEKKKKVNNNKYADKSDLEDELADEELNKYIFFLTKAKIKERKSIKSIFEVHY